MRRVATIALWFAAGCGDHSDAVAVDGPAHSVDGPVMGIDGQGGPPDATMADASIDGAPPACDLTFDDQVIASGAEVSAAVAPDGTMVIGYCSLGLALTVVRGNARTLMFEPPQTVAPGFCDPTLAYSAGTFYLADDCRSGSGYGICLHVSADMGRTWSPARFVDESSGLVDRPWIFAVPGGGALMTWNHYPGGNLGYTYTVDVASDGTLGTRVALTNGSPACTSMPGIVDPSGDVFAVGNLATDLAPASENGPMYLWSKLEGASWTHLMMPSPDGPVYAYPSITSTPDGTLHVFYTDERSAVYLTKSMDRGQSWSPPQRINPQSQTSRVVLVWAAAGDDGLIRMTWYERVAGSNPPTWHVYYARSDRLGPVQLDQGAAFRGTNGEYDDNFRNSTEPWLGDFTAVLTDGVRDYVVYTANSEIHLAASRCR